MAGQIAASLNLKTTPSPPSNKQHRVIHPTDIRGDKLRCNLLNKLGIDPAFEADPPIRRQPSRGSLLGKVHIYQEQLKDTFSKHDKATLSGSFQPNKFFVALGSIFALEQPTKSSPCSNSSSIGAWNLHASKQVLLGGPSGANDVALEEEFEDCSVTTTSSSSSIEVEEQRHVRFCEAVTVIPIPQREEYSDRIRKHLWDTSAELEAMILRNTIEFAADGYDAQRVLEEEEHIWNPDTQELVHPIHFEIAKVIQADRLVAGQTVDDLLMQAGLR